MGISFNPKKALDKLAGSKTLNKIGAKGFDLGAMQRQKKQQEAAEEQIAIGQINQQNTLASNLAANMKIDLGLDNVAEVIAGGEAEQAARSLTDEKRRKRSSETQLSSVLGIRL